MDPYPIGSLIGDLASVAGLILLGSFFVAAEIALISLRESQVRQLSSRGKRGAKVSVLTSNPNRFLAAAQVGVTVCGFLSAALGAERLGVYVIPQLVDLGLSDDAANVTSLIGVTLVIAYFSLVFESADAFGRQWGSGSENEAKGADWKALWLRLSQEPTQVLERKGSDLIYEQ